MSLQELHINNFKFFREVDPDSPLLKINGRHVLIYGENGSGKSTIYWALYNLLESSFKQSDSEIVKYFDKRKKESLVNIDTPSGQKASLKAVVNVAGVNKEYKVSSNDLSIRIDADVKESNMASDFINYRVLFRLHDLKHSESMDLFPWFYEEVLPYVKKNNADPCLDLYREIKNGPAKVLDINGNQFFPTADLRTDSDLGQRQNYLQYKNYKTKVGEWNTWLKGFLERTVLRANQLLQSSFGYNFQINIVYEKALFKVERDSFEFKQPEIELKIIRYNGTITNKVKKPHTFLNEAKWSAIGLSIRLAILDAKLVSAELKCLVIDDMLLSLDMKHRHNVIDLLLSPAYSQKFQIILMTHDRYFYELAKRKINVSNQTAGWYKFLMYEETIGGQKKPLVLEARTNLEKAISFYKDKEFAASANHLRKASEDFVTQFVPLIEQYNVNYRRLDLSNLLTKARMEAISQGWPPYIITNLDLMRQNLFNPMSHHDISTPIFQNELNDGIELMNDIKTRTGFNL